MLPPTAAHWAGVAEWSRPYGTSMPSRRVLEADALVVVPRVVAPEEARGLGRRGRVVHEPRELRRRAGAVEDQHERAAQIGVVDDAVGDRRRGPVLAHEVSADPGKYGPTRRYPCACAAVTVGICAATSRVTASCASSACLVGGSSVWSAMLWSCCPLCSSEKPLSSTPAAGPVAPWVWPSAAAPGSRHRGRVRRGSARRATRAPRSSRRARPAKPLPRRRARY